jgi:hypothetical protein
MTKFPPPTCNDAPQLLPVDKTYHRSDLREELEKSSYITDEPGGGGGAIDEAAALELFYGRGGG